MKRLRHIILASFVALLGLAVVPMASSVSAINVFDEGACPSTGGAGGAGSSVGGGGTGSTGGTDTGSSGSSGSICGAAQDDSAEDIIKNVINTLLFVLGMIAVIMIVIGGIRYSTSGGDSTQIQAAKNTILYAVVGLVVAILSFAIVNFVLGAFN